MRLPRDLSGEELAVKLRRLGYVVSRQTGSHMRLTSQDRGEHHITIPRHDPLKIGTMASIFDNIAAHHGLTRDQLLKLLGL